MQNNTTFNKNERMVGVAAIGALLFGISYFAASHNTSGLTASVFCFGTLFGVILSRTWKGKRKAEVPA